MYNKIICVTYIHLYLPHVIRKKLPSADEGVCPEDGKEENMKFSEMPYKRVDMEDVEKKFRDIMDSGKYPP